MLGKVTLLVAVLLSAGCTPGMFFDLLDTMRETSEQTCHRTGGVYTVESLGDGHYRHECHGEAKP